MRVVFINEEFENLKVVVESLLEITKRSQAFYKSIDLHSVTNAVSEGISLISKRNIVNHLGKDDFPYG